MTAFQLLPWRWRLVTVLLFLAAACAPPESRPGVRTIRVAYSAVADFDDLPSMLAHERLEAQGYTVQVTHFRVAELAAEALARGDADFAMGSVRSFWAAAGRGAAIRTLMEQAGNFYRLVATSAIGKCGDLDGQPFALHSEGAAGTALARAFLAEECPNANPRFLMLPQSDNRAAALRFGAINATVLAVAEVIQLDREAPGRFHVIGDLLARWPQVKTSGVYVTMGFAAANPDVVRDYVRALLLLHRQVAADSGLLLKEAPRLLGESPSWPRVAQTYSDLHMWDPNGGLTPEDVARTLAFFIAHGSLDARLTVDAVADLSFLNSVLTEIGRDPEPTSRASLK